MKTKKELIEEVKNSVPPLGIEFEKPLFKKYGYTYSGIGDGWIWKDNLSEATTDELWEMLNFSNEYWYKEYRSWYNKDRAKMNLFDSFIGDCEMNYFGYDENGYTLETVKRIIGELNKILYEKYKR